MPMLTVTKNQARQFILLKQGLLGDYRFIRKDGAYQFVRQAGCIQFDPVDVCGRNAELTLQSRVKGFRRKMLNDLLYRDRLLVDTVYLAPGGLAFLLRLPGKERRPRAAVPRHSRAGGAGNRLYPEARPRQQRHPAD